MSDPALGGYQLRDRSSAIGAGERPTDDSLRSDAPWSNQSEAATVPADPGRLATPFLDFAGFERYDDPPGSAPVSVDPEWAADADPGMPCDLCHDAPVRHDGFGPPDGRRLGTWRGRVLDIDLTAGRGSVQTFAEVGAARGYGRTIGGAAAVVEERDGYRVFEVTYLWPTASFTREGVGLLDGRVPVDPAPGVALFVTEDGFTLEATACGTTPGQHIDLTHEPLSDGVGSARLDEVLAARGPGFSEHPGDDATRLAAFEVAMRLVMLDVLEDAEAQATARPAVFDAEYEQILATAEAIDATERRLDEAGDALLLYTDPAEWERRQGPCEACHAGKPDPEEADALRSRVEVLRRDREVLRLRYPLFARLPRAAMFLDLPREEQAAWVGEQSGGVLASIEQTRSYLASGELELWTLPPVVDATLRAGGFDDPALRERVLARAAEAEWDTVVGGVALAALSVGLGLAAAAATGGLAVALGGTAVAVGLADAAWQTGEYFEDRAASNTAEDPSESFVSPEQMQGAEFWLVVAWVGAGVDLASGVKVLGLLRAGERLADALAAVGHAGKELSIVEETARKNLLDELRRLLSDPGDLGLELAGGPGGVPDLADGARGVPNDRVRALYPEGWWSADQADAPMMAVADEWDDPWHSGGVSSELPSDEAGWRTRLRREGDLGEEVQDTPEVWEASVQRAGMARPLRHHVFPREHRAWFEERGFVGEWNIDQFTVELDEASHQAIHGGGDWRRGRKAWDGEWNALVRRRLLDREALKGSMLTRDEVFDVVEELMEERRIPRQYVPYEDPN